MLSRESMPNYILIKVKGNLKLLKISIRNELLASYFLASNQIHSLKFLNNKIDKLTAFLTKDMTIEKFQTATSRLQASMEPLLKDRNKKNSSRLVSFIATFSHILSSADSDLVFEFNKAQQKVEPDTRLGVDEGDLMQAPKKAQSHPKDILHKEKMKNKEQDLRLNKNSHFPHRHSLPREVGKKLTAFGCFASRQKSNASFVEDFSPVKLKNHR